MSETIENAMESGAAAASMSMADVPETDNKKKSSVGLRLMDKVSYAFALACAILSFLAMVTYNKDFEGIIYVAFIISLCVCILVVIQRYQLSKMQTLNEVMNEVRGEVNRLQSENNELTTQNNELEKEAKKVADIEKQLSDVVDSQGQNISTFVSLVKENAETLKNIKEGMKAQTMNDFMTVVLMSDRDEDFTIDPNEVGALIFRLENQAGVKINKELFKAELEKCNYKLKGVMELVKDIADDGQAIFTIEPKNQMPSSRRMKA
mmetsp:Transcript_4786/g.4513  ORF Transcript_4786/g.4513 Transcript_4786/m.4513 type:complete len:264 (-) Transcript_4786:327-1118(-)|eukprot:CAMPEP_0197832464 /NCGR_PEP_ID=MMETSP1437-20131217/14921_1 /TAXON_ID=49252 ORGANISM="Eucampia antarctica, Strain CCMP1452" /NCGR_SAMPLE_ID=MMETSP1437 /ASSEMBLY_ACC=CAM_ASM_001096 /LENGTH=263 /DNA_ID=CAMNT_0043435857 /DNA_START=31 /DNA_END=822 /DNA_ORIENTATION=+